MNKAAKTTGIDAHRAKCALVDMVNQCYHMGITHEDAHTENVEGDRWVFEVEHLQRVAHVGLTLPCTDANLMLAAASVYQHLSK